MADTTAQAASVKAVAANIDACYKALQTVAGNLTGLLTKGKATCDDIRAYNLWAYATYQTQLAMLQAIRTGGDATGIPSTISYPTFFNWKGQSGININCNAPTSLNGALAAAMAPPTPSTVYLSTKEIDVSSGEAPTVNGTMPSYTELLKAQQGLGLAWFVWVIIAAVTVYLGAKAIEALFDYLQESEIQEETTARNAQVLAGYATQTAARLSCYTQCMTKPGATDAGCTNTCAKLVTAVPTLATGANRAETGLSFFSTIGLALVAALGGYAAFKFVRRDHVPRDYSAAD